MLSQLREHISRYLVGDYSVQDLETWLLSHLQEILDSGDKKAVEMADQVDADIVELGEGLIDEFELQQQFDSYLALPDTFEYFFPTTDVLDTDHGASDVRTITTQFVYQPGMTQDLYLSHEFL